MDFSEFTENPQNNYLVKSDVPPLCLKEPCILGIDEAGRGPVLGPMVYGCCYTLKSKREEFIEMGFADSKILKEDVRESLFSSISEAKEMLGWSVHILSPNFISNSMLSRVKYNLNSLSHDTAIGLIRQALDAGVQVEEIYVDTVGDPGKYQDKLEKLFAGICITVAKKADALYPVVSAASICAKVTRDRVIKNWVCQEEDKLSLEDYGSGYPADPVTKDFIAKKFDKVFGYPNLVRFSWSTAASGMEKFCVPVHWEDDEDDESQHNGDVSHFFTKKGIHESRSSFFVKRRMRQVSFW